MNEKASGIPGASDTDDLVLRIEGRMPLGEQRRAAEQIAQLATEPAGVRYQSG